MNKPYIPVYTDLKKENLQRAIELIYTIRKETRPIEGHSDPGAIDDCWNSLGEIVTLMAVALKGSFEEKTFSQKIGQAVTDILNSDYPGAYHFMKGVHPEEQAIEEFVSTGRILFNFEHGEAEQIIIGQF